MKCTSFSLTRPRSEAQGFATRSVCYYSTEAHTSEQIILFENNHCHIFRLEQKDSAASHDGCIRHLKTASDGGLGLRSSCFTSKDKSRMGTVTQGGEVEFIICTWCCRMEGRNGGRVGWPLTEG